jgi:hypothetical protein
MSSVRTSGGYHPDMPAAKRVRPHSTKAVRLPTLHRHAVESIFVFLTLQELAVVACISREWSAATKSMAKQSLSVVDFWTMLLHQCKTHWEARPSISLWRHVASLQILSVMNSHDVRILHDHVPQLTTLIIEVRNDTPGPWEFPPCLRVAVIRSCQPLDTVVEALAQGQSLSDLTLSLDADDCSVNWPCLAPLQNAPALRSLKIDCAEYPVMDEQSISDVRALGHLEVFKCWMLFDVPEYAPLILALPNTIRWAETTAIDCDIHVQNPPLLTALRTLTASSDRIDPAALALLPHLKHVTLWRHTTWRVAHALSQAQQLQSLHISSWGDQSDETANESDLATALKHLPILHTLRIWKVGTLSWIGSSGPLTALRHLIIERHGRRVFEPLDIRFLHTLKTLEALTIHAHCFGVDSLTDSRLSPLLSAELELIHPPSAVMPALSFLSVTTVIPLSPTTR